MKLLEADSKVAEKVSDDLHLSSDVVVDQNEMFIVRCAHLLEELL